MAKRPLTDHDVEAADIQAGVDRQKHRFRFAIWLVAIAATGFCVNTCLHSPTPLIQQSVEPSVDCALHGNVWHPESYSSGFFNNKTEAYCGPAVPCPGAPK